MNTLWTGRRPLLTAAACATLIAWGCGGGEGAGEGAKPSPLVVVDGSSTVLRISEAAQEAFKVLEPTIRVVVDNHGTGGGFGRYLQGEVDIIDASRPAKADEETKAEAQGIAWTRFIVGHDGITMVAHPSNAFAKSLSVEQLKKIWEPGSAVKNWKDVDASWPDRKIVLYSPDHDSGTFEYFTEAIVGKAGKQRDDVQASSDDNTLVSGVAGDPDGLGYFGYAYFEANKDKLRAIPVAPTGSAAAVAPGPETILAQSYKPLARPLFIYVKKSAARRPEVAAFLKFYLDNIVALAKEGGYVPPSEAEIAQNAAAFAGLAAGAK